MFASKLDTAMTVMPNTQIAFEHIIRKEAAGLRADTGGTESLLIGKGMTGRVSAGIRRGLNMLLRHSLDYFPGDKLKDGALQHVGLGVSLHPTYIYE